MSGSDLDYFTAFRDGLHNVLFDSLPPLIQVRQLICLQLCIYVDDSTFQTLGGGSGQKQLLLSICGRRVSNAKQVIDLLRYETVDRHFALSTDVVINTEDTKMVKKLISRYLMGAGHPMHPNWGLDHVDAKSRENVAGDQLMRARRLLSMVTGSELLPSDHTHYILVCLQLCLHCPDANFYDRFNSHTNFQMSTFTSQSFLPLTGQCVKSPSLLMARCT